MSLAAFIRRMLDAGAPSEAIAIAVEAIEEAQAKGAERRTGEARRTALYRARGGGNISQELRQAVFERDSFQCVYCGSDENLQCDHVAPVSRGGQTSLENLVAACRPCNARKRDRDRKYVLRHSEDKTRTLGGHEKDESGSPQDPPPSPSMVSPTPPSLTTPTTPAPSPRADEGDWPSNAFQLFWKQFPNRIGKRDAENVFHRIRKGGKVRWVDLLAGLERYVAKTDDRPWCNPATWLRQDRWEDQPAELFGKPNGKRNNHPQSQRTSEGDYLAGLARGLGLGDGGVAGPADEEIPSGRVNIDA